MVVGVQVQSVKYVSGPHGVLEQIVALTDDPTGGGVGGVGATCSAKHTYRGTPLYN